MHMRRFAAPPTTRAHPISRHTVVSRLSAAASSNASMGGGVKRGCRQGDMSIVGGMMQTSPETGRSAIHVSACWLFRTIENGGMGLKDTVKTIVAVEFGEPERAKANWVRLPPSHVIGSHTLDLN